LSFNPESISLRPAEPGDEGLLFSLYASSHGADLASLDWSDEDISQFLRMQREAEVKIFAAEFPQADNRIIIIEQMPIGRLMIERREREFRGIDMTLLPDFRNLGIGSALIRQLQAEAAADHKPIRMQLIRFSRAVTLFERLGFVCVSETGTHFQMEWQRGWYAET
jgi:GNAT superfamily N-acetyltransferase